MSGSSETTSSTSTTETEKTESKQTEKTSKRTTRKKKTKAAPPKVSVPKSSTPVRRVSFVQWAASRRIPRHHHRGMLAFVKKPNRKRSLAEWDLVFRDY